MHLPYVPSTLHRSKPSTFKQLQLIDLIDALTLQDSGKRVLEEGPLKL